MIYYLPGLKKFSGSDAYRRRFRQSTHLLRELPKYRQMERHPVAIAWGTEECRDWFYRRSGD